MSSATVATALLAQAMAEYVVSMLGRAGRVFSNVAGDAWSFVTDHPWAFGGAFLLLVLFLARR